MSNFKYQKKPVIIDAFQWQGNRPSALDPVWLMEAYMMNLIHYETVECDTAIMLIETLEGTMRANPGDFIIRGIQGELYPCKEDIFNDCYIKV